MLNIYKSYKYAVFVILFIAIIVFIFFKYTNPTAENNTLPYISPSISQEDIDKYIETTLNASFVKYLRGALNRYIADESSFKDSTAYASEIIVDQKCGLKSFDTSYYSSKFSVASVEAHPGGGVEASIIFISKPDKVFTVWIYGEDPNWEIRSFCDLGLDDKTIKEVIETFKPYITDPQLSI